MNPISLTDAAVGHIKKILEKNEKSVGFRLSIKKTGCSGFSYVSKIIEQIEQEDVHFVAQDKLQIYVDPNCIQLVKGLVIDCIDDETTGIKQKKLAFINPNEKNRCGCGESFTVE